MTLARPALFGWTALVLAIFAMFNILLARTVLAWVDRWLAKRRTREIVSAIFLLLMLSLQLLNPALRSGNRHHRPDKDAVRCPTGRRVLKEFKSGPRPHIAVVPWLPPGLAAALSRDAGGEEAACRDGIAGCAGVLYSCDRRRAGSSASRGISREKLSETPAARKRSGERQQMAD